MYNLHSRVNAATGQTPSRLLLGTDLVRPGGWHHPTARQPQPHDVVAERHRRVQQAREYQTAFQRNLYPEPRQASQHFRVGDKVLIRSFSETRTPFGPTWTGPYPVIAVSGDNVYEVDRNGSQERYHVDDLRPDPSLVPALATDGDPLVLPLIDDGLAPRDKDVSDDVAGETTSQVSDESADPGLGRLCHPQHTADDGVSDAPDEPAFLGPGHLPYSPCPELSRIRSVVIEDVSDSEDDVDGCNALGTPIVGLWP